jgi:hypothetical protein
MDEMDNQVRSAERGMRNYRRAGAGDRRSGAAAVKAGQSKMPCELTTEEEEGDEDDSLARLGGRSKPVKPKG